MNPSGIITLLIIILLLFVGVIFYGNQPTELVVPTIESEPLSLDVVVRNVHDSLSLSPGVYAVHSQGTTLDYRGILSPSAFEIFAEVGTAEEFSDYVREERDVISVVTLGDRLAPGEEETLSFTIPGEYAPERLFVSGIHKIMETNDGYAALIGVPLRDVSGASDVIAVGENFDNGTEENEPVGSGFEGGQPDATRGDENIDNGTPTDPAQVVTEHLQVFGPMLEVMISAQ